MSRTPFIAANWKMYKTVHDTVAFIKELRSLAKDVHDVEIVVAPPFTALRAAVDAAHASAIGIAGQNLHWEREGAFTGEVSAAMLKDVGAEYVIIGHSERRRGVRAAHADRLHRRDAGGTGRESNARRPRSADQGRARRADRRPDRGAG